MSTNSNEVEQEVQEQIKKTVPEVKPDKRVKAEPEKEPVKIEPIKVETKTEKNSDTVKMQAGGTTCYVPRYKVDAYKAKGYKEV